MPSNIDEPKCFYCGRTGHVARECYKKKNDYEARHKNRKHSRHFAEENPNIDPKYLKLFVFNAALSAKTDDVDAWFVDSGASFILMTYINFKETHNGAHIYLGDDHSYQIGIWRYYNSTYEWYCQTHLQYCQTHFNVVYVPEIKKNLIYVSTITNQNLKVNSSRHIV
jgi:hypothetical protein